MSTPGRSLCLAIPGLSNAVQECAHVPAALKKIFARSNTVPCAADYTSWLFQRFGVSGNDYPVAAVTHAADSRAIEPGWWLRADPVYMHADGDSLLLFDNRSLSVSQEEAAALALELQELFQEHDARLSAPHPKRWYAHFTHDPGIKTHALDKVLGKHIHAHLPYAEDVKTARRWRSLLNEIQMRLYASPVNQARIERNELPVNSVWFWGEGHCPQQPAACYEKVYANEPLAQGLALLSSAPHEPVPSDVTAWHALSQQPGDYLVVLDCMTTHTDVLVSRAAGCRERPALEEIETRWLTPLLALVRRRDVESLTLWLGTGKQFEVTRRGLLRWWRRSRPLANYL